MDMKCCGKCHTEDADIQFLKDRIACLQRLVDLRTEEVKAALDTLRLAIQCADAMLECRDKEIERLVAGDFYRQAVIVEMRERMVVPC